MAYPTTLDPVSAQEWEFDKIDEREIAQGVSRLQSTHQRDKLVQAAATPAGAGTVTPDCSAGLVVPITMPAGNITIAAPTNARAGDILQFLITQDGVGSRTVTWDAAFKKAALTLTTTASATDSISFRFDGTNWNETGRALAIS